MKTIPIAQYVSPPTGFRALVIGATDVTVYEEGDALPAPPAQPTLTRLQILDAELQGTSRAVVKELAALKGVTLAQMLASLAVA
jgi:hypothetical protein